MFYSHEILTNRRYGVATVWLVATLGSKSSAKKVTRKAILDVDVSKACETIVEPEAPMALRLQSSLLFGVTRVYDQQCGYVLHDVQAALNSMRVMLRSVKNNDLEPSIVKARPDQIMIMDDPAFNIDAALPGLDFDLNNFEFARDSQRSTQSMLSISSQRSGSVSSHASGPGINLPSSSGNSIEYQLPNFGQDSASKPYETQGNIFEDDGELFQDEPLFEFDADGGMRDVDEAEHATRRAISSGQPHIRIGSDSAASGRVRKEHEDAYAGRILPLLDADGDYNMLNFSDDAMQLPDAEPLPMMTGGLGRNDVPRSPNFLDDKIRSEQESSENSSETAEAPQKRRKPKLPKKHASDRIRSLGNNDLIKWTSGYLDRMAKETRSKLLKLDVNVAKKNAAAFLFGHGLNGIGSLVAPELKHPLAMFSGPAFFTQLTGREVISGPRPKAPKRARPSADVSIQEEEAEEDEEPETSPKRARKTPPYDDEVGRAFEGDDNNALQFHDSGGDDHDSTIELGRAAGSALLDHPSSALMPWNASASLRSASQAASLQQQQQQRRMTSASPLVGHGSVLPEMLGNQNYDDDEILYGRSLHSDDDGGGNDLGQYGGPGSQRPSSAASQFAEFEIFGAAAAVDTQTAASSQWVKQALDRESENFFEFVRNSLDEKKEKKDAKGDDMNDEMEMDSDFDDYDELGNEDHINGKKKQQNRKSAVTFEELFDPEKNSCIVAAQAFYHVLTLATRRRIWLDQDMGDGGVEPWGEIRIGIS